MALLPPDNVFLLLVPIRQMMSHSALLRGRSVLELSHYVSVPRSDCIVGHVANFLADKARLPPEDHRPVWTYPFTLFVQRDNGEFLPLHKRFSVRHLIDLYPFAYKASENEIILHYTHGFEMPLTVGVPAFVIE